VHWLQSLDLGVLRFINETLSNPVFDRIMPFASGNRFFFPLVFIAIALLLCKGGARGRLCVLMIALIVGPGDGLICNTIKRAVARPRPYVVHSDILLPANRSRPTLTALEDKQAEQTSRTKSVGPSGYNSMPSSHAANWFAATMILLVYYRRSLWFMLPLACLVSFSRVYNGVHYPSDVLAGAILGAGYAAAGMWVYNSLWRWVGRKWFPLWWRRQPSLVNPDVRSVTPESDSPTNHVPHSARVNSDTSSHWIRLGYLTIALLLLFRLAYISSGRVQLSEDEAYQWVWSKHLALSYYSKPPMIAYTQFLGTHLGGDTEFGVRFFSPVLAALTGLMLFRFVARYASARAAFILLIVATTTPLLALGSILMTIDPLSVFFWVMAMLAGWRAVQPESTTKDWIWTGLWMGLGLLSKYTELLQWICLLIFFLAWKPARQQLRRPGPYVALLVNALCALPILIWNSQHHWVTVSHVATNAGLHGKWSPHLLEFLGQELALLNPVYLVAALWAAIAFWRSMRTNGVMVYLFCMGVPLFLGYLLWSIHSRVLPNWIAPSVPPMFCLMVIYWREKWRDVGSWAGKVLAAGIILGLLSVAFMHETDLVKPLAGRPLPPRRDPMTRIRGWREAALQINDARKKLEGEGKPAFIISGHYGIVSLFNFYIPEARTNISKTLLAYCRPSDEPRSQYSLWPEYDELRKGENAIYVRELTNPKLVQGWFWKWLKGKKNLVEEVSTNDEPPAFLLEQFDSVKGIGQIQAVYRGDRILHTFELYECRNLH
jgi:membrane-associated phospholipid phosphatase